MDVLVIIATASLASFGLITIWFLKKMSTPKEKPFPICFKCGRFMPHERFTKREMPNEIKAYLDRWNLPETVIRKHTCPRFHKSLWIAPPIGDMEKSLYVVGRA